MKCVVCKTPTDDNEDTICMECLDICLWKCIFCDCDLQGPNGVCDDCEPALKECELEGYPSLPAEVPF